MEQFGRYRLRQRLAVGGMAEIYLAQEEEKNHPIVVKRLLPHLENKTEFVQMFADEAHLTQRLDHPNLPKIHDFGRADGTHYIVMEFVDGLPLSKVIPKIEANRLPLALGCWIIAEACAGMSYAHQMTGDDGESLGIVHRDISPDNIMLSKTGRVKLLDFGVAKAKTQINKTRPGHLKGKLAYMSPEQALVSKVDHRSDIFSLGLVLYEITVGRHVFDTRNEAFILRALVDKEYTDPTALAPDYPRRLAAVTNRALAWNIDQRFQRADEMQAALVRLIPSDAEPEAVLSQLVRHCATSTSHPLAWNPDDASVMAIADRIATTGKGAKLTADRLPEIFSDEQMEPTVLSAEPIPVLEPEHELTPIDDLTDPTTLVESLAIIDTLVSSADEAPVSTSVTPHPNQIEDSSYLPDDDSDLDPSAPFTFDDDETTVDDDPDDSPAPPPVSRPQHVPEPEKQLDQHQFRGRTLKAPMSTPEHQLATVFPEVDDEELTDPLQGIRHPQVQQVQKPSGPGSQSIADLISEEMRMGAEPGDNDHSPTQRPLDEVNTTARNPIELNPTTNTSEDAPPAGSPAIEESSSAATVVDVPPTEPSSDVAHAGVALPRDTNQHSHDKQVAATNETARTQKRALLWPIAIALVIGTGLAIIIYFSR